MTNSEIAEAPKARRMQMQWIIGIALVAMGLYMVIGGYFTGGSYFGKSSRTQGTVVQLQDDRPVVSYLVDGTPFQQTLNDHGPQFQVGQTIDLCFSQANPAGAQTCSDRNSSVYGATTGIGLIVVGLVLAGWVYVRRRLASRVQRQGGA